jgi:prephenate dehydratase/chorismate mutase/prephenate dehydratase
VVDALVKDTVTAVHDAVASGVATRGVVPIENTVEGHVVPTLDALIGSPDVLAVDAVTLTISFDAFVRPGHGPLVTASAHPHGLAQCARFVAGRGLVAVPTSSNAAACRDLEPDGVALGPRLCGSLYGLDTLARGVEDYPGAQTRFLVLARRDDAAAAFAGTRKAIDRASRREAALARWSGAQAVVNGGPGARSGGVPAVRRLAASTGGSPAVGAGEGFSAMTDWRTMLAITPVVTGPGVLARVTAAFGADRVNMSSLVTRPLKAATGQYAFVVTLDGAPWDPAVRTLARDLLAAGDHLKVIGAYPAAPADAALDGVLPAHVPTGSVCAASGTEAQARALQW